MGQRSANWSLVLWPGSPAAVPSSARVSEEMSEERGEPPRGAGDRTSPWESDPQLPIGTFPAQVRAAASASGPSSPARLAVRPSHMAGTRPGLARGADRQSRRPVRGWGWGTECPVVVGLLSVTAAVASGGGGAGRGHGAQRTALRGSTEGSERVPHVFLSHAPSHTRAGTHASSTRGYVGDTLRHSHAAAAHHAPHTHDHTT